VRSDDACDEPLNGRIGAYRIREMEDVELRKRWWFPERCSSSVRESTGVIQLRQ
jgi:hypothetical protein